MPEAKAAPCCASLSSLPALITSDDLAEINVSVAASTVVADAYADGLPVFRGSRRDESSNTLTLSGARIIGDRFQVGASLPFVWHGLETRGMNGSPSSTSSASSSSSGDLKLATAYEILPEWGYSNWRPKGYVFLQLVVPTGRSIYDSKTAYATDASGQGFYSPSLGFALVKRWSDWDASFIPEIHYGFARTFDEGIRLKPGVGGSLLFAGGYSLGDWRFGGSLRPDYSQGAELLNLAEASSTTSVSKLAWDTTLSLTKLFSDEWTSTVSYTDQTLFGPARNTTLSRSFAIVLQRRFSR